MHHADKGHDALQHHVALKGLNHCSSTVTILVSCVLRTHIVDVENADGTLGLASHVCPPTSPLTPPLPIPDLLY